ncbi:MAG: PilZ domain-containing protein [Sphingopyxis sp.]|nr:PilZ domain-containing protein [Sphingopyxis sp.]
MDDMRPLPRHDPGSSSHNGNDDQREGQRIRTVCRFAKVIRVDDAGLWLVRNISNGGMMLSTQAAVQPGERVTIALSETIHVDASVVWCDDGRCGVAFDEEIDGPALLKRLAVEQAARGYRQPRIPVQTSGRAVLRDGWQPIELTNLSQQGAGFVHDGTVKTGTQLELVLGRIVRKAIVRWSRGREGGLWLTQPLDRADMESIRTLEAAVAVQKSSARRR